MAKTIIIKGADYDLHKLDTVTFGTVPCTGIELSDDSFSLTDYSPVTIGCTLTPANTTDTLLWESSDENVVTVSDGVITAIGIGTATITASCGNQTATASVSVDVLSIIPNWMFGYLAKGSSVPYATYDNTSYSRISTFGKDQQKGNYQFGTYEGVDPVYVVKLPKGTEKVKIKRSNDSAASFYSGSAAGLYWMKDEASGSPSLPNTALYVSEESFNMRSNAEVSYSVPQNVDAIGVFVRLSSAQQQTDVPNTIAQTVGLTVEFYKE